MLAVGDAAAHAVNPGPRSKVHILHAAVPGRVRLRIEGLRRSPYLKSRLVQGLSRWGDIRGAWPSTDTGNLLVLFDPVLLPEDVAARVERIAYPAADHQDASADNELPWHHLDVDDAAAELGTSLEQGLHQESAERRLAMSGPNAVPVPPARSSLEMAAEQFRSLPVLLLVAAGAVSLLAGGAVDAVAILGVITLNATIGFAVESRSEKTIRSLDSAVATTVTVLRDGTRRKLPSERLVAGDLMLLARGDAVCADARIVRGHELFTDEAMLTGESQPVRKDAATLPSPVAALADRHNMVWRGTVVTGGTGAAVVTATGVQTEIGRLQRMLGVTTRPATPMQRDLDRLGHSLTWASITLGGAVAMIGLARGQPLAQVLRLSAALAIAAIPEGLPTVASTTLARSVEVMRRRGVLVRRLDAVETLGATQVLCFDKTGTLTFNRMAAASVALAGRADRIPPAALPALAADPVLLRLLEIGVLCSEVSIDPRDGTLAGSETETALMHLAQERGLDAAELRQQRPIIAIRHRSDAYRFMATTHRMPDGSIMTAIKGDPLEVLGLCDRQLNASGVVPLTSKGREAARRCNAAMAGQALRVLGFAFQVEGAASAASLHDLVWVGLVGLTDTLRPSAEPLMRLLRRAHIHPLVLTGDQVTTARAVADQTGLNGHDSSVAVDAAALTKMSPETMIATVRRAHVFARVTPAEKLQIVQTLQRSGVVVGMVGDGFNDSPALKAANVGIAIGSAGAEAARDAADIVMQTEDLCAIAAAIEQGRAAHANVRRAVGYLIGTNLSEIAFVMAGTAIGVSQPLSAAQLLWINIVSDVLPGVGLSAEPPDASAMLRPPRSHREGVLGADELPRLIREGGTIAAGALASAAWGALRFGAGPQARMMGFGSLVLGQLLHALNRRAPNQRIGSNPTLTAALALSFGAQAVALLVPPLRAVLEIVPLDVADIAVTVAGGVLPYAVNRMLRPDQSAACGTPASSVARAACSVASST